MAEVNFLNDERLEQGYNTSDNSDFEGFGLDGAVVEGRRIVRTINMTPYCPDGDRDLPADLANGWSRFDTPPIIAPFTGESKLNIDNWDGELPIDYMKIFLDDACLSSIVTETNVYAQQRLQGGNFRPHARQNKWKNIDLPEMKIFISLVIAMGLVVKNDLELYWSSHETHNTPFFRKHMSRDRFQAILSNLHVNNNDNLVQRGEPGFDPLHKLRPFITKLSYDFSSVYSPDRDLSLDEATCGWKGNLRFRVYNPAKPTRFGIKLYQLCEASSGYCIDFDVYCEASSGYCFDFDVYTGDDDTSCTCFCDAMEQSSPTSLVRLPEQYWAYYAKVAVSRKVIMSTSTISTRLQNYFLNFHS